MRTEGSYVKLCLGCLLCLAFMPSSLRAQQEDNDEKIEGCIRTIEALGGSCRRGVVSIKFEGLETFTGEEITRAAVLWSYLRSLSLRDSPVADAHLEKVYTLWNLTELDLSGTGITDAACEHLGRLKRLRQLRLRGTAVTGSGILELRRLTELTELDLSRTKLDPLGFALLRLLPSMKTLLLEDTNIDELAVPALHDLVNLEELYLDGTKIRGEGGLHKAIYSTRSRSLERLNTLSLSRTHVNDDCVDNVGNFPALKRLMVDQTSITPAGVGKMIEGRRQGCMPELEYLRVSRKQVPGDVHAALIETFPNLLLVVVEEP
jgi:hypothetical protein